VNTKRRQSVWSTYRSISELYYVDEVQRVIPILSHGIDKQHATRGEGKAHTIVCFTTPSMATQVAQRLGIAHFALFAIKKSAIPKHCIQWENSEACPTAALLYCFCHHIDKDAVELVDCFPTPSGAQASSGAQAY